MADNVVIVFDTSRELCDAAVFWALDRVVKPGNSLTLLGILHEVLTPMGYRSRVDFTSFNGINLKSLEEEAARTGLYYQKKWGDFLASFRDFREEKKVRLEVRIVPGHPLNAIAVAEMRKLQAAWVVLDKNLKRYEKYLAENLLCNLVLMSRSNEGKIVKLSQPVLLEPSFELHKLPPTVFTTSNLSSGEEVPAPKTFEDLEQHPYPSTRPLRRSQWETREFTLTEIVEATENFSQKNFLSEGGFGRVFKGLVIDDRKQTVQSVAVKVHKFDSTQGEREFQAEIEILSRIKHNNVVTLIGHCSDNGHKILIYEYLSNGTLALHLSANAPVVLSWNERQTIAVGIAKALHYLHHECEEGRVIHRDIRSHNILLGQDLVPKVGDFGTARWEKELEVEKVLVAAPGYVAPEYAATGLASAKADVYAFGIVLLELITGRLSVQMSSEQKSLVEWAIPKLQARETRLLLDPRLQDEFDEYESQCMIHAAAFCLQQEPSQRLSIAQILRILTSETENDGF